MNGEHAAFEALLHGYRPVGPPPDLRQRIVAGARRPLWSWVAAAAVLLAVITAVEVASTRMVTALATMEPGVAPAIEELAMSLGGDAAARRLASTVVANQQADAALARRGNDRANVLEGFDE